MNFSNIIDDLYTSCATPKTPEQAAQYFAHYGFGTAAAFSTSPQYPAWLRAAAIVAMCKL